jgi:hypothetical protein
LPMAKVLGAADCHFYDSSMTEDNSAVITGQLSALIALGGNKPNAPAGSRSSGRPFLQWQGARGTCAIETGADYAAATAS